MHVRKNNLNNIVRDTYSVDFVSEADFISQLHFFLFFRGKIQFLTREIIRVVGASNIYSSILSRILRSLSTIERKDFHGIPPGVSTQRKIVLASPYCVSGGRTVFDWVCCSSKSG